MVVPQVVGFPVWPSLEGQPAKSNPSGTIRISSSADECIKQQILPGLLVQVLANGADEDGVHGGVCSVRRFFDFAAQAVRKADNEFRKR
jgi:hypothetical protein